MCGITGIIDNRGTTHDSLTENIRRMTQSLLHRGPDAGAEWVEAASGVALGHRRLAVVDLSENGAQPMVSADGRLVMVYNGEIYNADELRHELKASGLKFFGHSDTEVILAAFSIWGFEKTLKRLIGMFAIAVWDRQRKRLMLARDRLGIKPLYWFTVGGLTLFGSELKSLKAHEDFVGRIDLDELVGFFRFNYVPSPNSIYESVKKLEPGTFVSLNCAGQSAVTTFWSFEQVVRAGKQNQFQGTDLEATDALEELLSDAIRRRMVADVPLGAFLSGGVDSSTVVALMQAQTDRPIQTFSIGFDDAQFNEAKHAKAVADHLGTQHTEFYVSGNAARDVIPKLPHLFDEPFADASQIPTYLVCQMARQHVTVALSGDGGDELFAGYRRYLDTSKFADRLFAVPSVLRRAGAAVIEKIPLSFWSAVSQLQTSRGPSLELQTKIDKLLKVLRSDKSDIYTVLTSNWDNPSHLVKGAQEPERSSWEENYLNLGVVERMQYADVMTYLRDDILTKVDRTSMGVALEARVPILDHRLVEFSWSLPFDMKIRKNRGKWLLRQVLHRHVPRTLIERPKMGFAAPIADWLRGPLRDWAEALIEPRRLDQQGLLNHKLIQHAWDLHLRGAKDLSTPLWGVLMFQAWLDEWM